VENYHNCSVLCITVVHNGMHTYIGLHQQFLQVNADLGLGLVSVHLFNQSINLYNSDH